MAILVEKCDGEARDMVKNASEDGGGVEAFMKLHEWFTKISGLGMSERRNAVMVPNQAKREEDHRGTRKVETGDEGSGISRRE